MGTESMLAPKRTVVFRLASWAAIASFFVSACTIRADDSKASLRTWHAATGGYSVEAEFVALEKGVVRLKRVDDQPIEVPLNRLSRSDQQWLRNHLAILRNQGPQSSSDPEPVQSWHRWRGPWGDGVSRETGLLTTWPAEGPELLWSSSGLGRGHASLVIHAGRIYTLGAKQANVLICVDQSDGSILWETTVGRGGEPNCTPTVDPVDGLVYAISLEGQLLCARADNGEAIWQKSFASDFGGRMMSQWGYSESPLVDGDLLICTPGGDTAIMAALDKRTGQVAWTTTMPGNSAGYASPVISTAGGIKQYITLTGKGLIGVAASNGQLLWHYPRVANSTANVPTPIVKDDLVFTSTGYDDGGSALLKLHADRRTGVRFTELYYKRNNEAQNHHGGMVLMGDHVYMGHGHNNGLPLCLELRTGRATWGPLRGAGSGSAALVAADNQLYFRYENGVMALVDAKPSGYDLRGKFNIQTKHAQSWSHPVIQDGKLYLRDQHELHVYDISAR